MVNLDELETALKEDMERDKVLPDKPKKKRKTFKYTKEESPIINAQTNPEVHQELGSLANIYEAKELLASEFKHIIKLKDEELFYISKELATLPDIRKANAVQIKRIRKLQKRQFNLQQLKSGLNKIHGIRAIKEIELQMKQNLEDIKTLIHFEHAEQDEDKEQLKEFEEGQLQANLDTSLEELEKLDKEKSTELTTKTVEENLKELDEKIITLKDNEETQSIPITQFQNPAVEFLPDKKTEYKVDVDKSSPLYKKKISDAVKEAYYGNSK